MPNADHASELLRRGIAAAKAGHKEEARRLLMQVVELEEKNEQAWLWLSGVVETAEDRRICLENVLALNPDNAHAQAGLAYLDLQAPEPETAVAPAAPTAPAGERCPRCEAEVSPSDSSCPECNLPLIVACPTCGEYVDVDQTACPACGQRLGDFREGARYHLDLAQTYVAQRKLDRAEAALARAEAEAGDDGEALRRVAELYAQVGQWDRATATGERALELAPDDPALLTQMGSLYHQLSRPEEAEAMHRRAAEQMGDDPDALLEMAQRYAERDSTRPQAIALLHRVIEKKPMHAQAFLLLGDAYLAQGRRGPAHRAYESASKLTSSSSSLGREARQRLLELQAAANRQPGRAQAAPEAPRRAKAQERPGCVTLYAVLAGLGALFGILAILGMVLLMTAGREMIDQALQMQDPNMAFPLEMGTLMGMVGVYALIMLVVSGVNGTLAIGLWYMKNWARILVIVLQSLSLLGGIAQAAISILSTRQALAVYGVEGVPVCYLGGFLVGFLIQVYIIFWFVANGDRFA